MYTVYTYISRKQMTKHGAAHIISCILYDQYMIYLVDLVYTLYTTFYNIPADTGQSSQSMLGLLNGLPYKM